MYMAEIIRVANRGNIYDRNRHPLAVTADSYSLYAHPKKIKHLRNTASLLAKKLDLGADQIRDILKSDRPFVWVKRKLSENQKTEIEKLELNGLGFIHEPQRVYPNGQLAAHVVGYTDIDLKGLQGVEQKFDQSLTGIPKTLQVYKDARGRVIYIGESATSHGKSGQSLVLTIDKNIQYTVESELKDIVETYEAKSAMAIAVDPQSGEVLAMAIHPSFDPNNLSKEALRFTRNRLIVDVYEPGSTLKTFTLAAALGSKRVGKNKKYDCELGKMRIGKHSITDTHPYGELGIADILKVSSNICTVKIAIDVGKKNLYELLAKFGFGSLTEVDLPGEVRGIVPDLKKWKDIHLATISYGHGISVTAVQLTQAYSVLANGGMSVRLHVLKQVLDESGTVIFENQVGQGERIIGEVVAADLRSMLLGVTDSGGTAQGVGPFGYPVPGKTGTAFKFDEEQKAYKTNAYMSSFVGMFPANAPKVVLLILVDEPQKKYYGGAVAGPAFRKMSEKIINILSLYPQQQTPTLVKHTIPESHDLEIKRQPMAKLGQEMPDLSGMTLSEVRSLLGSNGWVFQFQGVGLVKKQVPMPNEKILPGTPIEIVLKP
jgi:cell division protein FtsI (penicillin-binding protein 3)